LIPKISEPCQFSSRLGGCWGSLYSSSYTCPCWAGTGASGRDQSRLSDTQINLPVSAGLALLSSAAETCKHPPACEDDSAMQRDSKGGQELTLHVDRRLY